MRRSRGPRVVMLSLGLALAAVVAVAGCVAGANVGAGGGGSLTGRTFLSERVTEDGRPRPLVPGTRIEVRVTDDGRITASAGCNIFFGTVEVTPDRLLVGDLSSTDMACTDDRQAQDELLAGVLAADPAYTLRGARLRLTAGGTVIRLVDRSVAEPDRPLEGTSWHVVSVLDGDVASSPPAGTAATLVFADGRVGVQVDDCNRGGAAVEIGASEIVVGPLAMTRRGCEPGPTQLEAAVTAVLAGTVAYAVDGDVLTLTHPSGRGLVLRAAPDVRPAGAVPG